MGNLLKALFAVGVLCLPLLVVTALPRFFEVANAVPSQAQAPTVGSGAPAFRLLDPTPASSTRKFAALDQTPPPTLAAPRWTATPAASPAPQPTGERVSIGNTGGRGAFLRAEPVSCQPVAALRDSQVLDVLDHRSVVGGGDWVRVRTGDGREGWITALVAVPVR